MKPRAIITDIDNTLSLKGQPNLPLIQQLRTAKAGGARLIIVTNRVESRHDETVNWLHQADVPYDELIMRPDSQGSASGYFSFKAGVLKNRIEPRYQVVKINDEQPQLWGQQGALARRVGAGGKKG